MRRQYDDVWINLPSPEAMRELEESVQSAIEQIELFPESAPQYRAFSDRPDIRVRIVGNYRLIYPIDDEELLIIAFRWGGSSSALD